MKNYFKGITSASFIAIFCAVLSMGVSAVWAGSPPVWTPDEPLVKQLAPAATTDTYQIQPPKGFTLMTKLGPAGTTARAWTSTPRADGGRVFVMLLILTPPPGEKKVVTLSQVSDKMVEAIHRSRDHWKLSASETGTVNGLRFIRTYWQGTDKQNGIPMHGFIYVGQDAKRFVCFSSQDVDAYAETTLPLMEASVLTFKRK